MPSFALFLLLLLSYTLSASSNSNDEFLQCLSHVSPKVLYTPKNSSYTSVLDFYVNNLRFTTPSTPKPIVIVTPTHESEIQTVIYCAKKCDIQIRTRGGGHDYEGLSYVSHVPFVLLDMNKLRSINVDPKTATAWVQAGATLGELYYKISEKAGDRYAFPGGVWYTVGVSGLVSGGGYGVLRRKYGLAADNVLDARIIDVNGRILDRKAMGEDLFWAIRGGGASSFGVILSWKLKLVPVPKTVTVFQVDKTLEQNGTDILYKWQTVAPKLTKNIEVRVLADPIWINGPNDVSKTVLDGDSSTNASGKTLRLRFIGLFLGRQEKLLSLMSKKLPELGMVKGETREVSFLQAVQLFSLFQAEDSPTVLLNRTSYRIPFKAKSDYVDKPISKEGLNGIWKMLLEYEPDKTNFIFTSYGGRMAEISESAIPFPHRAGTLYKMYMRVETYGGSNAMDWIRRLYEYLTPYVTKNPRTAYVNYNDLDLGVNSLKGPISYKQASIWGKKYFKNNFDRLVIVKSLVDPDNFFRHEQSIPPFSY